MNLDPREVLLPTVKSRSQADTWFRGVFCPFHRGVSTIARILIPRSPCRALAPGHRAILDSCRSAADNLTGFILSRYVVRQHQGMSYEKSLAGDRCLLQVDGSKVFSTGGFDKIGMGNPRLHSAVQILKDLGLMENAEDGVTYLTKEGKLFLRDELKKEGRP
jgi:hypothetical protein